MISTGIPAPLGFHAVNRMFNSSNVVCVVTPGIDTAKHCVIKLSHV